ncbi:MAG TPA: phosphopantetheine-binding protein [Alphaproteobacteria bacterium]|nr:phosphopantetheine-binding protein [Alphaproteobacteria bacterium]
MATTLTPSTFDAVCKAITDVCPDTVGKICADSHLENDLGIDSLDVLDINFGIEKELAIKLPKNPSLVVNKLCEAADAKLAEKAPRAA